MLTKIDEIDRIEVLSSGAVQVRKVSVILDNDEEISRAYGRWVLHAGDDLSGQDARVRRIAEAAWA